MARSWSGIGVSRSFRIVHLSDLHLTASDEAARSEPALLGKLRGMNKVFRGLLRHDVVQRGDLVLVTGDVTDRGDAETWGMFWQEINAAGFAGRCRVIPGNHDVCCLGVRALRSSRASFLSDVAKMQRGMAIGGQPTRFPWAERLWDGRIALLGLDSCNRGNPTVATNAVGELGFAQLEKLARLLREHADAPVKIVALHNSPNISGPAAARHRGLAPISALVRLTHEIPQADRRSLRLLCVACGVRLLLHGHLHRSEVRRVNSVRMVGADASTEPHGRGAQRGVEVRTFVVSEPGLRIQTDVSRIPV
jgi:3',5'-cyclic AMP phosphodiesterase CpdA